MTQEAPLKLVKLTIKTTLGAVYEFPDMSESNMESLLQSPTLHGFPQISLVNQSLACLVLPVRIIESISMDGVVRWRCPA